MQQSRFFRSLKEAICRQRMPQFIVSIGHNISEILERLFLARGGHSLLWPILAFDRVRP